MTEPIQKPIFDSKFLNSIAHESAETIDGLTQKECEGVGISTSACEVLIDILDRPGVDFPEVTKEEQDRLEKAGFARDFIRGLVGDDGRKALRNRAYWLGEMCADKNKRQPWGEDEKLHWLPEALFYSGSVSEAAAPVFVKKLKDPDPKIRALAVEYLKKIGGEVMYHEGAWKGYHFKEAEFALIQAYTKDPSDDVRYWAGEALRDLGSKSKAFVSASIKALKDSDQGTRSTAIYNLEAIGAKAKTAVPDLAKTAHTDPNAEIRSQAAAAIRKIRASKE